MHKDSGINESKTKWEISTERLNLRPKENKNS